jgi:TM2 domain-containing membrane protein YozV
MSDPYAGQYGDPPGPYEQPQYGQPQYGQPQYGQSPYGQPVSGGPAVPATPNLPAPYQGSAYPGSAGSYGVDPITGQPLSDKSKVVAGLLGIFLGSFGVGRFYTGHIGLAIGQIGAAWGMFIVFGCLGFLFFPLWVLAYAGFVWPLVDGIVMLAGRPTDSQGRVLRS